MEAINNIVGMLNGPIWGVGMLVLIVGSGLYFTIRLGFFQFVHFKDMWSRIIDKSESIRYFFIRFVLYDHGDACWYR